MVRLVNYWCWREVIILWLGWLIIDDEERLYACCKDG